MKGFLIDKNAQDQLHATDSLRAPSEVTNTTTQNEKRVLGGPPRDPRNMLGQLTPVADKINKMLEDVKTSRKRSTDLKKHPGVLPLETNYVEDPLQNASLEDPLQNASLPRTRAVVNILPKFLPHVKVLLYPLILFSSNISIIRCPHQSWRLTQA